MRSETSDTGNFDDLVFEIRNKEYGAYQIRKLYNRNVLKGLIIALLAGLAVIGVPYLKVIGSQNEIGTARGGNFVSVQMDKLEPPDEQIYIPPAPPPPPESTPVVKYVAPVIVDTVLPTEKPTLSVDEYMTLPVSTTTEEITVVSSAGDNELVGEAGGEGEDEPFIIVEVKPTFMGGDIEKFRAWVIKRVVYPREAEENGIQGRVYLTFVVERDGTVSNVQVVRGVDKLLDDAAKKAIEASPAWTPGLQRGRPVRVRFSIFLNFTL